MKSGSKSETQVAAISALQWWLDAGVDLIVDEEPRNWLAPRTSPAIADTPAEPYGKTELPDQLDLFHEFLRTSDSISFSSPSAPRICPSGDPTAGLMIMTDMPSADDCDAGILMSGETGQLFERMLAAIGKDRNSVYLASLSCIRSPTGRLTGESATQCATLARHHIGLAAPKVLLLFGDSCSKALLGLSVVQARGRVYEVATHAGPVKTIVTFAPAYLADQPRAKANAWADLQLLMKEYKE